MINLYYAVTFTVYTDNNSLTYILNTAKLNAVGELAPIQLQECIGEYTKTVPTNVVAAIWQGEK